jgi:hypothetical protein
MAEDIQNSTPLELLKRYALSTKRQFFSDENQISARFGHTKRMVVINEEQTDTLLAWYSDPSNLSDLSMFSGAAFPFQIPEKCQLMVAKNTLWSRIFFVGSRKKHQSDNHIVNSNLIIRGEGYNEIKNLFERADIYNLMIEILELDQRIRIYFNGVNYNFFPQLKGKMVLSVIARDHWVLDHSKIEEIFFLTEKLRNALK